MRFAMSQSSLPTILIIFCTFWSALFSSAQDFSPSVPPQVVESVAAEKAAKADSSPCDAACASLSSKLKSQVFLKREGSYSYWDEKVGDLEPACRVEPASPQDVSVILETVKGHGCHFSVKSGGHQQHPGATNADGGVSIDLRRLDQVELSKDHKTTKIGSGARWGKVYKTLEQEGLYVLGGRVSDVGVGGLILGAGISFFSHRQGFACDSVLEYSIVLPTGEITTASEESHPDLYKALKGAGQSNFGIVTEFTVETHEFPNPKGIWFGSRTFTWDKIPQIHEAHTKYLTESLVEDSDGSLTQFNVWAQHKQYGPLLMTQQFHTTHDSVETWPKSFEHYKEIESIPDTDNIRILPMSNITDETDGLNPYGFRNAYLTFCFKPSVELEKRLFKLFEEAIDKLKDVDSWGFVIVLQGISRATMAKTSKHGGNPLGLSEEDGPLVIWHIPWAWKDAKDTEVMNTVAKELLEKSEDAAKEMGLWHPYKYANYAEEWEPVYEGYGEKNHNWLKEVQRKYDPDQVFTKGGLASGSFKLNKKSEDIPRVRDEL